MNESVARMAQRAGVDPFFLAFALAEYAADEGWDDAALAAALGTTADVLPAVRLCRAPRADPAGFRDDVGRIAAKFGVNRDALAVAARRGQVVAAMQAAAAVTPDGPGTVLAARDRPPA